MTGPSRHRMAGEVLSRYASRQARAATQHFTQMLLKHSSSSSVLLRLLISEAQYTLSTHNLICLWVQPKAKTQAQRGVTEQNCLVQNVVKQSRAIVPQQEVPGTLQVGPMAVSTVHTDTPTSVLHHSLGRTPKSIKPTLTAAPTKQKFHIFLGPCRGVQFTKGLIACIPKVSDTHPRSSLTDSTHYLY